MLTILTRTFKRPTCLEKNQASLSIQTSRNFEQVIIEDKIGIGIAGTHKRFQSQDMCGDYVWIFDDDNVLTDGRFIERLESIIPFDVCFVETEREGRILPATWPPTYCNVDAMNIIVSREVWERHRKDYAELYEGDWHFIKSVLDGRYTIKRLPGVVGRAQRISKGVPEMKVGDVLICVRSRASATMSYVEGREYLVTPENIDEMESGWRVGKMVLKEDSFRGTTDEGAGPKQDADTDVLPDIPGVGTGDVEKSSGKSKRRAILRSTPE